jgi:hypothetical protein
MDKSPLIATIGTGVTVLSKYTAPDIITIVAGTLTAIYTLLKIIGWFLDRRKKD